MFDWLVQIQISSLRFDRWKFMWLHWKNWRHVCTWIWILNFNLNLNSNFNLNLNLNLNLYKIDRLAKILKCCLGLVENFSQSSGRPALRLLPLVPPITITAKWQAHQFVSSKADIEFLPIWIISNSVPERPICLLKVSHLHHGTHLLHLHLGVEIKL